MSNFELAQKCINDIDDYLEYAYRSHAGPESLRNRIMEMIGDYTEACGRDVDERLALLADERQRAQSTPYKSLYGDIVRELLHDK